MNTCQGIWAANACVGNLIGARVATNMLTRDHYDYGNFTTTTLPVSAVFNAAHCGLSSSMMALITSNCG